MRFIPFVIYTFIGSFPWCYLLSYIGFKMGDNWDTLGVYFHRFDAVIGVIILGFAVWWIWRHIGHVKNQSPVMHDHDA